MNKQPLHKDLRNVPRDVLEDHVLQNIRQFAVLFATELMPGITQQQLDIAFSRALYALTRPDNGSQITLELRFSHNCRYLGCTDPDCALCKNNPHKTCNPADLFDEAYADNQVLKARCEAELYVELVNATTGEVYPAPGVEVQLSVIDGDAYSEAAPDPLATIMELHTSDEVMSLRREYPLPRDPGVPLLNCFGSSRAFTPGTVVISLQNGRAKLPEVFITDKNDTFHFSGGSTTGHFRLMGLAMRRDELGQPVPVEGVGPVVSNSFVVKTQRALNDYRKSAYPHYKDELTRLRFIGAITATRLKDAKAWLGKDVPLDCVDSVESLKKLLEYADTNRQVENKLLELLNMRGKHKHKWDFLRSVLTDKVVYDDSNIRVWYAPEAGGGGLLYYAKQAQVAMDKPAGVVQRMVRPDGSTRVQVMSLADINQHPQLLSWRRAAEVAWKTSRHTGWQILQEPIEWVNTWAPAQQVPPALPAAAAAAAAARNQSVPGAAGGAFNDSPTAPSDQSMQTYAAAAAAVAAAAAAAAAAAGSSTPGMSGGPHQQQQQQQHVPPRHDSAGLPGSAAAAAAAAAGAGAADYPAVSRQELEVQLRLHQQLAGLIADYPDIGQNLQAMQGFGMGQMQRQQQQQQLQQPCAMEPLPQQNQQQQQTSTHQQQKQLPPRPALSTAPVLDPMAMRSHSTTTTLSGDDRPYAGSTLTDDARQDSVFLMQHAGDAIDLQLRNVSTSTEGNNEQQLPAVAVRGGSASKRNRAASQDVAATVGPNGQRLLVPTASRGRHQPTMKTSNDAACAAAGARMGEFESLTAEDLETLHYLCDRHDHVGGRDNSGREPAVPEDEELPTSGLDLTNTLKSVLNLDEVQQGLGGLDEQETLNHLAARRQMLRQCDSDSFKRIICVLDSPKKSASLGIEALLAGDTHFLGTSPDAAAVAAIGAHGATAIGDMTQAAAATSGPMHQGSRSAGHP